MSKILTKTRLTAAILVALLSATPAFAVNKDMVQLQTQVQQLLDAVARLQQSNDERMGVLKDLVQQSADSVNRLSVNMDALQKQLAAQSTTQATRSDQVSTQVQALNDSLDEIRARMMRLEKVMNDVQNQQQSMSASLQPGAIQPGSIQPGSVQPALGQSASGNTQPGANPASPSGAYIPGPSAIAPDAGRPSRSAAANSVPVTDLYRNAYSDYMAARYPIASSEFEDIIKTYPDEPLAGNAFYYLGEIDYRAGKFANASHNYDKVLEQFPDNNKIPAAHLHKGQALIELKQQEAGIRELRTLIQRFPASPEATQARAKLNALGVPAKPRP